MTPQRDPTNNGRQPDSNPLLQAIQRSAIDDDHLGDAELIELSAEVLDEETARTLRIHVEHCSQCRSELGMMQARAREWTQHGPAVSLQDRLRSTPSVDTTREEAWWTRITSWISLAPVRTLQGAYASGRDVAAVDFPVYDGSRVTSGLRGSLQRRNNEYYIRISTSPNERAEFDGRQVEVVLADPETGRVMLQRKVQLDQILLLGTDLQITTQQVTARLIP